jgi:hypothetical protein
MLVYRRNEIDERLGSVAADSALWQPECPVVRLIELAGDKQDAARDRTPSP